jgi:Holliday junction resolvase RusA-like endonuclease
MRIFEDEKVKMQKEITFFVQGVAAPGGSKKGFYIKSINRVVMAPDSKKTKPWMALVSACAKEAYSGPLLTGAIELSIQFRFCRPKGHYGTGRNAGILKASAPKYHTVKPDCTKCLRSTEDAMTGIIFRDDSQVVKHHTSKVYVERDCGAMITVTMAE